MSISNPIQGHAGVRAARSRWSTPRALAGGRLPTVTLGVLGASAVLIGVRLPWLSTFNRLLSQSGWGTRNGTILTVGAAVAGILALASLARPSRRVRWLLALTGFGLAGFSGYLLIQLYGAFAQLDAMSFAAKGPGLYVAAAGSLAVFATVFLPMPGGQAADRPSAQAGARRARTARVGTALRFPTAALALVAGLAHVPVTPEHLVEAPYIGILFMSLTVLCVLGATALMVADTALVYAALGAACVLAAVAYVLSRTVGLPLMSHDVGNWLETLGVVATLAEAGVATLVLVVLRRARAGEPVPVPASEA